MCWSLAAWTASAQPRDLASRAAAARHANDLPAALELYRQAVQEKPGWLEGWWFLGLLSYKLDQFADGRQAFTEFTKLNANAPSSWAFLGLCEYETGDYDDALQHLERGLAPGARLDPQVEQVARFHRALLLTRAGSFDRARDELQPFVERGIHDPILIAGVGLNALELPVLPREVPAAQRDLVETAGQTACTWIKGDSRQTEAAFRSLLNAYPNAPGVHYLYASYLLTSRPEAVNAELQRELEVNPGNARVRAVMALRLRVAGDPAAALPFARKAAADAPGLGLAQYAYGVVLTETGALSDAIVHLQAAVRIDPANLEYHTTLATAYSEAGHFEDAYRERQASIKLARESRGPG
ncbi:MAG TPA: tetratricopeptide repeat protein [Bryobacteraceae bacterium]